MVETLEAIHVDAWAQAARAAIDGRLKGIPRAELDDFWRIVAITYCRGPADSVVASEPAVDPIIAAASLSRLAAGTNDVALPTASVLSPT